MATQNNLTTLPLKQLMPWEDNPRKIFDDIYIEGLAQSIKTDGVLDNLIVTPAKGKKNKYEILSGECRFRAMKLLVKEEAIPKDYDVPVSIRKGLEVGVAKRLAVMANVQRKDMHPMDEARAVTGLIHDGVTMDDISVKTGLSKDVIRKRIALTSLCEEAQDALSIGEITLSVAQALTLGTHDRQKQFFEEGLKGVPAQRVISQITNEKIPLSSAIFDVESYKGNITRDLFFSENDSFFDDRDQFFELQNEAVDQLVKEKEEAGFSPVEICNERWFSKYEYRQAEEGEIGGCVIHYSPDGDVAIHEGLVNRKLDKKTCEDIKEKKPKPTYSHTLCEYIAMHKSMAVQSALINNPRKAKELAVVQLLCGQSGLSTVTLRFDACHRYFEKQESAPRACQLINKHLRPLLKSIGIKLDKKERPYSKIENGWHQSHEKYYEAVKALSDDELDKLHLVFTTLCFGQGFALLDTQEDSLFNKVANDLKIDMRDYWYPDEEFLKRRTTNQLAQIILETDTGKLFGSVSGFKKKSIVSMLTKHFEKLAKQDVLEERQDFKAKNWLPEAMSFPVIDPDNLNDDVESENSVDEVA